MSQLSPTNQAPADAHGPAYIRRTVHFYRLINDASRPVSFDWAAAVGALASATPETRVYEDDAGSYIRLTVHSTTAPYRLALTWVRKNGLPKIVYDSGRNEALNLRRDAGLGETSHALVRDGMIVFESNGSGPRPGALFRFLLRASPAGLPDVRLGQVIRGQIGTYLANAGSEVTLFRIRVPIDLIETVADADEPLASSLRAGSEAGDSDTVEVVLRRKVTKGHPAGVGITPARIMRVLRAINPFRKRCVLTAQVKTPGEAQVPIDLLGDPVVTRMEFAQVSAVNRVVSEDVAFAVLAAAYTDMEQELRSAIAL